MNNLPTSATSDDSMDEQRQRALKQRRRRRRVAAGRSGGTFELLRHGNQLTYQYVSPDQRRHQPGGRFSWDYTPSTDGFDDFNARSVHSQGDHDSTPKISPLVVARESKHESRSDTVGTGLPQPTAHHRTPRRDRYHAYVESVYSGLSAEEATYVIFNSPDVIPDTPSRLSGQAAASQCLDPETGPAIDAQNTQMAATESQNESLLGGIKMKSPTKKKTFGRMKDIRRMVKKIVHKKMGTSTAGEIGRLFNKAFHGNRSTVDKERLESVCGSQNVVDGVGFQGHLHNPSTPQGRTIERTRGMESDSPVKDQLLREQENDEQQERLNKTFFTPPAGQKESGKRSTASLNSEVFD
ncbi:hypothetical protein LTR84_005723 [Exophiala bonariae]|uniref:Uncharacterized protein n=1 Tax=Exophiala bonariae TaxID=1690606 RepID=A0AAV9N382_9EURO|nr:hypothetical protein LTR84_005723 [Exophiala bonariae]